MGQKPQNKMTEVAKMFGKSLDEKFEVFIEDLGFYDVKFTEGGLITLDAWGFPVEREETHVCLQDLFTGDAVITE
jgi:hypothetical protein